MGYNEGESVIDYSYCEADVFKDAKSNIRYFIQVIIGIVLGIALLGLLLSTLLGTLSCLGGCLGCDACLESAACADEMGGDCLDCSYVEMTQDNIEKADARVSCDGIDCFGREGCFACNGCGDCSDCNGKKYYRFTIVVGGQEYDIKIDADNTDYLDVHYPSDKSSTYYQFKGYYNKEVDGKQYVNEKGEIVKTLKNDLVLYAQYVERNVGESYTFNLDLEAFGQQDAAIAVKVGDSYARLPEAPAKTGYEFDGWYLNGTKLPESVAMGGTFHLYDFGISPSGDRTFTLVPKYVAEKHTIHFVLHGYTYDITVSYGDTFGDAFEQLGSVSTGDNEHFYGWSYLVDGDPDEAISGDTKITADATLYAIIRQVIYFKFYYNTSSTDTYYVEVPLVEKATNVKFAEIADLNGVNSENANPGYKFKGWYTTKDTMVNEEPDSGIDLVEKTTPNVYYAHWEETEYTIEYYVKDYNSGETSCVNTAQYSMSDSVYTLWNSVQHNVGYEFKGWCMKSDYSDTPLEKLPAGTYGNKKLYAKYEPEKYTLNLSARSGTFSENGLTMCTVDVTYGEHYELSVPVREGYNFLGFYYKNGAEEVQCTDDTGRSIQKFTLKSLLGLNNEPSADVETQFNNNLQLYAQWKLKEFTVTFMNGNSRHESVVVEWNKTVELTKANPTKTGYTFANWVYENGTIFDFSTKITGDLTLYADYTINKYTVEFVYAGESYYVYEVEWNTPLKEAQAKSKVPEDTERRRLLGWYKDANCNVKADELIGDNTKVYAKYQDAKKFTFHGAAGDQEKYYFVGDTVKFPEDQNIGYSFVGWCANSDCSDTPKLNDVKIIDSTAIVYYPKYTAIEYTITYYIDEGNGYVSWKTDIYTIAETKYLIAVGSSEVPMRTGYTFTGWKDENNVSKTELSNTVGNKKFYAQYKANEYTVTLYDKDGKVAGTVSVTYDAPFKFGVPTDKEGYDFRGWSWLQNGGAGDVVTDAMGDSLSGVKYVKADNANAYPVFTIRTYSIHWKDPANTAEDIDTTTAEHFGLVTRIEDPIKTGYTFQGWYTDKECTEEYDFANTQIFNTRVIYAKFTINQYNVQFSVGNVVQYTAQALDYNSSLQTAMEAAQGYAAQYAERTNSVFDHWEATLSGGKTVIYNADSLVPAENLTLRAIYKLPVYVKFVTHTNDIETKGPYYDGDVVTAYTYEYSGYDFVGWYTEGTFSNRQEFPFTAKGNYGESASEKYYTFYAKFNAKSFTINYYIGGASVKSVNYTMDDVKNGLTLYVPEENLGYDFNGWYVNDSSLTGTAKTSVTAEDVIPNGVFDSSIDCYGEWKKATYTITFVYNGETVHTETVEYGQELTTLDWLEELKKKLPSNVILEGWKVKSSPNASDVGKTLIEGTGHWLSPSTYEWTGNLVLEADWYTE